MTANESETSAVQTTASDGAAEELWLTYLNYDQRVGQAVRRLGALSAENVDLFRGLLLKSRDRSKINDYEAESIRRLQGEAFVGDEELQRTLIVLTAEDPRYGEELKRLVAATGKPAQLDQAVAAIRSGKASPVEPVKTAEPAKDIVKEIPKEPAKASVKTPVIEPTKEPAKEPVREAVVVPLHKEQPAPAPRPTPRPAPIEEIQETAASGKTKRLAVIGAIVLVGAAGMAIFLPGLVGGNKPSGSQTAAIAPVAKPQATVPAAPQPPAPAVDIAIPDQAGKSASASPPLRPASAQPDAPPSQAAPVQSDIRPAPAVGSSYKVVRGDMLSDIALKVYHDASKFRLIQSANPGIRNSPDRILVDQVIFIPPDSGPASR